MAEYVQSNAHNRENRGRHVSESIADTIRTNMTNPSLSGMEEKKKNIILYVFDILESLHPKRLIGVRTKGKREA